MADLPVVFTLMTRCGARAVPEPWRATTGLVIANSAMPPVVFVLGLVWFAITLTGVEEPSATIVWGSTPVALAIPSPRYPMIPGTCDQSLEVAISDPSDQSCAKDTGWATVSARATSDRRTWRARAALATRPAAMG